jgi:hypothetical protein
MNVRTIINKYPTTILNNALLVLVAGDGNCFYRALAH